MDAEFTPEYKQKVFQVLQVPAVLSNINPLHRAVSNANVPDPWEAKIFPSPQNLSFIYATEFLTRWRREKETIANLGDVGRWENWDESDGKGRIG